MDAESKVMMIFVGLGSLIGILSGVIELGSLQGFILALLFFYLSYRIAPSVLNLEETSFEVGAWNIVKTGAIPYWFLWLIFWTLIHTLKF